MIEYDEASRKLVFWGPGDGDGGVTRAPYVPKRLFSVKDNEKGFRGYWLSVGWRDIDLVSGRYEVCSGVGFWNERV